MSSIIRCHRVSNIKRHGVLALALEMERKQMLTHTTQQRLGAQEHSRRHRSWHQSVRRDRHSSEEMTLESKTLVVRALQHRQKCDQRPGPRGLGGHPVDHNTQESLGWEVARCTDILLRLRCRGRITGKWELTCKATSVDSESDRRWEKHIRTFLWRQN